MSDELHESMRQVRQARAQAETMRDQLMAEYQRLCEEADGAESPPCDDRKRHKGLEAMRKAVAALDCALASIDQELREMERVRDDQAEFDS